MSHKGTIPIRSTALTFTDCLEAVVNCDVFIGIINGRYGSGKIGGEPSITHQEMRRALELTTHPMLSSNIKFMNFYPFNDIETISPRLMLFITGAQAHSRQFSENAFKRAGEPKELVVIPNAGHVDLYDKLDAFFKANLK